MSAVSSLPAYPLKSTTFAIVETPVYLIVSVHTQIEGNPRHTDVYTINRVAPWRSAGAIPPSGFWRQRVAWALPSKPA